MLPAQWISLLLKQLFLWKWNETHLTFIVRFSIRGFRKFSRCKPQKKQRHWEEVSINNKRFHRSEPSRKCHYEMFNFRPYPLPPLWYLPCCQIKVVDNIPKPVKHQNDGRGDSWQVAAVNTVICTSSSWHLSQNPRVLHVFNYFRYHSARVHVSTVTHVVFTAWRHVDMLKVFTVQASCYRRCDESLAQMLCKLIFQTNLVSFEGFTIFSLNWVQFYGFDSYPTWIFGCSRNLYR